MPVNIKSGGLLNQVKANSINIPIGVYGKPSQALTKQNVAFNPLITLFISNSPVKGALAFHG